MKTKSNLEKCFDRIFSMRQLLIVSQRCKVLYENMSVFQKQFKSDTLKYEKYRTYVFYCFHRRRSFFYYLLIPKVNVKFFLCARLRTV